MATDFDKKLGARIKQMRERANLTQEELSDNLGISRVTLSQIESGNRQLTPEEIMKLSRIFNTYPDILLNLKKDVVIALETKPQSKPIGSSGIRISVPQKNVSKFKEVLLYILKQVGSKTNIGESVIYKLLYFIDFDYYEKHEEQLIGAAYIKNHYGPTPVEFQKIVKQMEDKDLVRVETKYFKYPQTKYLPRREPDLSELTGDQLETINHVLSRLSDMNAHEISAYSHDDVPWLTTEDGKIIDYESVFYRTPAYSVRSYDDKDIQ